MIRLIKKNSVFIPVILLIIYFIVGLSIYKDYGATADETIQIQAGHIIWRYICQKFGFPVPEALTEELDLHGFKNSYYGQAATFPTVFIEELNGFHLDSSTIIRIRHLWNFLCFFAGLCFFTLTIYKIYGNWLHSTLCIFLIVLLPRIFGDIFYNDRDVMLISWMMLSLSAFYWLIKNPGKLSLLVCGVAFGITFNTRIFGLVILIFPVLFFLFSRNRYYFIILFIVSMIFWFIFSPIAWENPIETIPRAFIHLATQQRSIDTNDGTELLFFGKKINETKLPWYYIPLYIIVTTPVMTTLVAVCGSFAFLYRLILKKGNNALNLISSGMLIILISVQLVGIVFHLTFYDGWRHFYFLYLPVIWFSVECINYLWRLKKQIIRFGSIRLFAFSFLFSLIWII